MSMQEKSVPTETNSAPEPKPKGGDRESAAVMDLRSKIQRFGARSLTTAELLALVLAAHRRRAPALTCAERLVTSSGNDRLASLSAGEWAREAGVGIPNACRMAAVFELGRRFFASPPDEPRIGSPAEAYAQVRDLARAKKEHLVALYLDAQNRLIHRETVSIGSLNTTRTHPREVMLPGVLHSALAFVLVHNHPSGSLDPSRDDVDFTRAMQKAGELMGISLYDHLIVSSKGYVSLKERGLT